MYTLYSRPQSGGFVVEAALVLAGAPYRRVDIAKSDSYDADFLKISPLGLVPAVTLPEGAAMTESAAICLLLAERHPQADLAPAPGSAARPEFLRWMAFLSSAIYPPVLRVYHSRRYTADKDGAANVRQAAVAELDRGFAVVDSALQGRDWLTGDAMSIADIYLLMLFSWHPQFERASVDVPAVTRLCAGLRRHPVLAKLNGNYEIW